MPSKKATINNTNVSDISDAKPVETKKATRVKKEKEVKDEAIIPTDEPVETKKVSRTKKVVPLKEAKEVKEEPTPILSVDEDIKPATKVIKKTTKKPASDLRCRGFEYIFGRK
jgi:hypothetical protein